MRIWIRNYSVIRPLVNLTRKGSSFVWQEEQEQAMQALKDAIINTPSPISIHYSGDIPVFLSIDARSWLDPVSRMPRRSTPPLAFRLHRLERA